MPLMTLASTAIDNIQSDREHSVVTCMRYMPTDSALFWTSGEDRLLLKKQRQHFEPLLRWARREVNLDLPTTEKMIGRLNLPEQSIQRVKALIDRMVSDAKRLFTAT